MAGGRCGVFFLRSFVRESIYFLLHSEPEVWKHKWKPVEEQTCGL